MQSMFDERRWLAWLVKVRIIILTFLLGIELAIARLTPTPFPLRLFVDVILLWYAISVFYLLLLSFWQERRIQSLLQVLTDLVLVTPGGLRHRRRRQLAQLPLSRWSSSWPAFCCRGPGRT